MKILIDTLRDQFRQKFDKASLIIWHGISIKTAERLARILVFVLHVLLKRRPINHFQFFRLKTFAKLLKGKLIRDKSLPRYIELSATNAFLFYA